jgi:signal transduction histidine kinase
MGQNNVDCEVLAGVSSECQPLQARRLLVDHAGRRRPNWIMLFASRRSACQASSPQATGAAFAWPKVGAALALLAVGTAAVLFTLAARVGSIDAPGLRPALETTMGLFALAAAWLLRGEFASARRLRDLLLLAASLALGLTNFCLAALPAALDLSAGAYFSAAQLWGQLVVGALFAAAAFTPPHRVVIGSIRPSAIVASLGVVALALAGLGGLLPATQAHPSTGDILGHPLRLILVFGATGTLAGAAAAFARRRDNEASRAAALLALALFLLSGATLSVLHMTSLYPGQIGAGEELRLVGFALILAAAVLLDRRVRRQLAKSAALAERRRVARDLHDGLMQDLAFIAAHGPSISREMGDEHPVVVAARRALAISRNTISELTDPEGATAHESLEAVAEELRDRFNVKIAVHAALDRDLASDTREHVTRIAREAIVNAARHGGARNVIVSLRNAEKGVALRVVDDGRGIGAAGSDAVPEGFGLRSMRERAGALGGYMSVRPARRGGTELEVLLP